MKDLFKTPIRYLKRFIHEATLVTIRRHARYVTSHTLLEDIFVMIVS